MKYNVYLVRESAWQSIIADTYLFALIGVMLWLNYQYFGNHGFVAAVLIFMAIVSLNGKKKVKRFDNKEELIKYLNNPKSNDNLRAA